MAINLSLGRKRTAPLAESAPAQSIADRWVAEASELAGVDRAMAYQIRLRQLELAIASKSELHLLESFIGSGLPSDESQSARTMLDDPDVDLVPISDAARLELFTLASEHTEREIRVKVMRDDHPRVVWAPPIAVGKRAGAILEHSKVCRARRQQAAIDRAATAERDAAAERAFERLVAELKRSGCWQDIVDGHPAVLDWLNDPVRFGRWSYVGGMDARGVAVRVLALAERERKD